MATATKSRPDTQLHGGRTPARKGLFITFEGGEGAGKSSQIKRVAAQLKELGNDVLLTREPGGSPGAEAVRYVLLSGSAEKLGTEMEAMLFAAARSDHVETVIKPALARGEIVLCDRFLDSSRVYQGITGKVDKTFLSQLEAVACEDAWPDLTIMLDVPTEIGMKRAAARRAKSEVPDRYEKETLELQDLRRQGYLDIAKAEPERCSVVDGDGTPAQVYKKLWTAIEGRLGDRLIPTPHKAKKPTRTKSRAPSKRVSRAKPPAEKP